MTAKNEIQERRDSAQRHISDIEHKVVDVGWLDALRRDFCFYHHELSTLNWVLKRMEVAALAREIVEKDKRIQGFQDALVHIHTCDAPGKDCIRAWAKAALGGQFDHRVTTHKA